MNLKPDNPPRLSEWLMKRLSWHEDQDTILDNLREEYGYRLSTQGNFWARWWYRLHVLRSVIPFIAFDLKWRLTMFKNYLKTALRVMRRSKGFTMINVIGLAIGMACVILIALYIYDELIYDRHYPNAHRIYRLMSGGKYGGPIGQGPLGQVLREQIPEIEDCARIYATRIWGTKVLISHQNKHFFSDNLFMVDPSFLDIFDVTFIRGSATSALSNLESIIITEAMARQYFGDSDPMGRTLSYDHRFDFVVTGVVKDMPRHSHFHFDFLIPLENYGEIKGYAPNLSSWGNGAFLTYFLLSEGVNVPSVESKLADVVEKRVPPNRVDTLRLMPVTKIHLHSQAFYELEPNGDIRLIWIFSAVAAVILVIACANYVNLTTARSLKRIREIGMRKVVGANRRQLIVQFLGESVLTSFLALAFAWCLVLITRPLFSVISDGPLSLKPLLGVQGILIMLLMTLMTGLTAGSIPAFAISSFKPKSILAGRIKDERSGMHVFRRVLVVLQFTISIGLMIFSVIILKQMDFIQRTPLGFNMERMVIVPTHRNPEAVDNALNIKQALQNVAGVADVTLSSHTPGKQRFYRQLVIPDLPSDQRGFPIMSLWTDADFAAAYRLEFLAGRDYNDEIISDRTDAIILNESAVRQARFISPDDAIGKRVECNGKKVTIIGVVKDFHFVSLHKAVEPIIMWHDENRFFSISVRIHSPDTRGGLNRLKTAWQSVLPSVPFDFFFLDERYESQYASETRLMQFFNVFTLLAVFISCLGMTGLAAFSAERRIKEIGIRKVLGASAIGMVSLLSKQFLRWVLLANLLAWPVAWHAASRWLQTFSYRIPLNCIPFFASTVFSIFIALTAVGCHAVKAATANPVDALKYE